MTVRSGWLLAVSTAVSTLMACAHGPEGYRAPGSKPDGVLVVKAEDAARSGLPEWSLAMPLGEKEDASVLEFLARAEASGARYVSDVDIVFAGEKNGQLLQCRTHITPIASLARGWRVGAMTARGAMRQVPVTRQRQVTYVTRCGSNASVRNQCQQGAIVQESVPQFQYRLNADLAHYDQPVYLRRWRLQKSAPECTPLEGGEASLVNGVERVEGRVFGCGEVSGCEDQAL